MQHGICKTILFLTLSRNEKETTIYSNNPANLFFNNKDFEEIIKITSFIIAGLSISGFPFLSGFISKSLIKNDLPKEALLIFNSGALLTAVVYVKLISSRIKNIKIKYIFKKIFNYLKSNFLKSFTSTNITLLSVCSALFAFSFLKSKFLTFEKVQMSFITIILGFVFYISFMGLESNQNSTRFSKTIDIIGAPFVIAALLLANLTYLKIL
jgi:multicomponent Na+:H+ antiporter subunit D